MIDINKVFLIGRVTRVPYITGDSNSRGAMFTLKVENGNGWSFVSIVGFRSIVDFIEKYISLDKKIYVEGRLNQRKGTPELEVVAERIEFVESKRYEDASVKRDFFGNSYYTRENGYFL